MHKVIIGNATLYCGDCRDVLPTLGKVDAVVTDPPYGIARVWKGGSTSGWVKAREQTEKRNEWDDTAPDMTEIIKHKEVIIWGGNYFDLPVSRGWLIWTKPERGFSLSEAEMAWTNKDTVVRVWDGVRSDFGRLHPTQKPLGLMKWCIEKIKSQTILDPFMGSGTTGVAAVQMGRKFIGVELDEDYFKIACKRIEDAQRQGDFLLTK